MAESVTGRNSEVDVTVAMLTRDAGPLFRRVIDAIRGQDTKRSVEIFCVDSGSTDGTLDLFDEYDIRYIEIPPESFNFGATRDLAYEHALGEIVVNLSQDAVPAHAKWLENLLAPLDASNTGVSCGRSIPDSERGEAQFPWERNGYFYFTREYHKFVSRYGRGVSFANSAVRREVWRRFRFDPQPLGEDFQFQQKLHMAGMYRAFPDEAEVFHHHNYNLQTLYRRCRDEGVAASMMGCPYTGADLIRDLASPAKYVQWLRELKRGSLRSGAAVTFPVLRPLAVYTGSRFGQAA